MTGGGMSGSGATGGIEGGYTSMGSEHKAQPPMSRETGAARDVSVRDAEAATLGGTSSTMSASTVYFLEKNWFGHVIGV